MSFDPEASLYVFEIVLIYAANGVKQYSPPCTIQADDPDEAEEKVLQYLDDLDVDHSFQIEEISEPYDTEEYQQQIEDNERRQFPVLDELTEDELKEYLGF
jgi:hypothetical protein